MPQLHGHCSVVQAVYPENVGPPVVQEKWRYLYPEFPRKCNEK